MEQTYFVKKLLLRNCFAGGVGKGYGRVLVPPVEILRVGFS